MTAILNQDSDVYFGEVGEVLPKWRQVVTDEDPDDELLQETPSDVVSILGFDPLEFEKE